MATYAIGDVQGCYADLQNLLQHIAFDSLHDQLWFTGDLVNRGAQSLEVLRFLTTLPKTPIVVLGNHDLHLLATVTGVRKISHKDTFADILHAPDCMKLCEWLRHLPLLHHDVSLGYVMAHAGLAPQWTLQQAKQYAAEVEAALRSDVQYLSFLRHMYGNWPVSWDDELQGWPRLRLITNYFTRMRFCHADGSLELTSKAGIDTAPDGCFPWFEVPNRANQEVNIIFGHWAALGGSAHVSGVFPLDAGCVWGGKLMAMRLEDQERFSVPCEAGA